MENNKRKKIQFGSLKNLANNPMESKQASGELSDDELDKVAGGTIINNIFYIAKCPVCGWQSAPFDDLVNDADAIIQKHEQTQNCTGELMAYGIDSSTVEMTLS